MADTDTDLEADVRAAVEGTSPEPVAPEPVEAGPVRDEHGRFAQKVDKENELAESPQSKEPQTGTILPPRSWTAAAKAKFATLDPDVQQEVLRREKEIDDGKAQWESRAEQVKRFESLFEPVKDRLTLSGIDQFAYTQALLKADELLRTNPQAGFQQLAQLYGFQFPGTGQQPPQAPVDPHLSALQQQVQQLTQVISSQQSAKEQQERQATLGEIEAFRSDPKHLYFDNVKPEMVKLLESGICGTLAEAYDLACYRNPDVKAAMAATFTPGKPGKPKPISVTGSPGQGQQAKPGNSRTSAEDDVRAALEELSGRI